MTFQATLFVLVLGFALLFVKRSLAAIPLLLGTCYMTLGQGLNLGGLSFPFYRLLILFGLLRVVIRGERLPGGLNGMDRVVVLWGLTALVTVLGHSSETEGIESRLGLLYTGWGLYFLFRILIQSPQDVLVLSKAAAYVMVPLALSMVYEKLTMRNHFSFFGGVPEISAVRGDRVRAQGPFAHPILAGTAGAVTVPLMLLLWQRYRALALTGLLACFAIAVASASSGPLMSLVLALGAVAFWHWRAHLRTLLWGGVVLVLLLAVVMKAPVWYLIARIDLVGGSTGFHRAELINSAIQHLGEWWLAGTDYTRHWMVTGVTWSEDHTDITNYYIKMGVLGGLPLMSCLIGMVVMGFRGVSRSMEVAEQEGAEPAFLIWCLGSVLFCHAATFVSVSYFDQVVVFWQLAIAMIASVGSYYRGVEIGAADRVATEALGPEEETVDGGRTG